MFSSRIFTIASPWEYRYRGAVLFLSQPALALLSLLLLSLPWTWYLGLSVSTGPAVIAVGMASVGVAIRIWGTALISAGVMASRTLATDRLVTTGPFRYVRNPLYLGSILVFGAYGVLIDWKLAVGFVVFHWLRYLRIIGYEQSLLRQQWGGRFDAYCRRVPRLLPRLGPAKRDQATEQQPAPKIDGLCWRDGLLSNLIFLGMVVGYGATLFTANLAALVPFEAAGFVLTGLYLLGVKRRKVKEPRLQSPHRIRRAVSERSEGPVDSKDTLRNSSRIAS